MKVSNEIKAMPLIPRKVARINWELGNSCNYNCSYCPEVYRLGNNRFPTIEQAIYFCNKLFAHYHSLGKRLSFNFTGGEPSLYPDLPTLLQFLKSNYNCNTQICSNGSSKIEWWQKIKKYLDSVVLTHHIQYFDKYHFKKIIQLLNNKVDIYINIAMLPERFDDCLANALYLANNTENVIITLEPVLLESNDPLHHYSQSQKSILENFKFQYKHGREIKPKKTSLNVLYENLSIQYQRPTNQILNDFAIRKGWKCNSGLEILSIDSKGDIFRCVGKAGGSLGNILNSNYKLPDSRLICNKKDNCHCIADAILKRSELA